MYSLYFIKRRPIHAIFGRLFYFFEDTSFCRGKDQFNFDGVLFRKKYGSRLASNIRQEFSAERLDVLARQHRFKQRESKLLPHEFVDTLMFSELDHSQVSLQDCCNDLSQQHQKRYSKVALHKRFDQRAVDFLKSVLGEQLSNHPVVAPDCLWNSFNRILIGDSCKFSVPAELATDYPGLYNGRNGAKALMNLQYGFDLKSGRWQYLEFTKATENDQSYSRKIMNDVQPNDLHIRDLGYVTHHYLQTITACHAYYINRIQPQWTALQKQNNKRVDWKVMYRKIKKHNLSLIETEIVFGDTHQVPVRLILSLVPESVYKERLAKAEKHARQKGHAVSEEYRIRSRFNAFITNIPHEKLSAEYVKKVYSIRWQIELVFKTWKSLSFIHKNKAVKKHRFECQLLAKFIWILLNWKIFHAISKFILEKSPNNNCSIWKFFKYIRQQSYSLRMVIGKNLTFERWCEVCIYPVISALLIEPKKHKPTHHQILNQAFLLS